MNMYVLVDCNNFFVSCERLFNPRLENLSVIVLSSNDGCVVARSQEAKRLGILMGEPYFKVRDLCERQRVVVYSSNFELYGDISRRVMDVLASAAPDIQIYSIDEAFLQMSQENLFAHCLEIRRKIEQWVGIPVSLGIGPTKTLAKAASKMAKKEHKGVFDLSLPALQDEVLAQFPVRDIWGVGRRWEEKLRGLGLLTAQALRDQDLSFIRKQMGVVGERIVLELRGMSCLELEEAEPNKSITCSRVFGKPVTEIKELAEAISTYSANACTKLREQGSCAQAISVYVEVRNDSRSVYNTVAAFPIPTCDTPRVIRAAKRCILQLFRPGQIYKKCGIVLLDLLPESAVIPDLFLGTPDPKRRKLAETIDAINADRGKNTLFYGAMGVNPPWKPRSEKRTARYTTSWDELPIVS